MLTPWLEIFDIGDFIDQLSEASSVDLRTHGTTSPADVIQDTAIAQPLIVAVSLAAARALDQTITSALSANLVAGHSVGEFTASVLAGIFSPTQAISLVANRGAAMSHAATHTNGGMSAVLGGDVEEVRARIAELGLVSANMNGAGQIVAAGALSALAELSENPPAKARVRPLPVAGAFHTEHMTPAQDQFAAFATTIEPQSVSKSGPFILTNSDGSIISHAQDPMELLIRQIASPVRWDLCQKTMAERNVTGVLELAPAGVLTGLARRTLPGVATLAIKSPDDLERAGEFLAEHLIEQNL